MFDINVGTVGSVNVKTSDNGGLTNEQVADLAVDKIVSISDEAPAHIRQQANQFREHLKKVMYHYLLLARKEERATIVQQIKDAGQPDLANIIRRL